MLSVAPLRMLDHVREMCDRHDVPVSLCGEMGGKPLQAMALLGIGFRRFSVPSAAIGPVKRMLRSAHTQRLEAAVREAAAAGGETLHACLRALSGVLGGTVSM